MQVFLCGSIDYLCVVLVTDRDFDALWCVRVISGSGSDAASLLSNAKLKGDHYVLNGSKVLHVLRFALFLL